MGSPREQPVKPPSMAVGPGPWIDCLSGVTPLWAAIASTISLSPVRRRDMTCFTKKRTLEVTRGVGNPGRVHIRLDRRYSTRAKRMRPSILGTETKLFSFLFGSPKERTWHTACNVTTWTAEHARAHERHQRSSWETAHKQGFEPCWKRSFEPHLAESVPRDENRISRVFHPQHAPKIAYATWVVRKPLRSERMPWVATRAPCIR